MTSLNGISGEEMTAEENNNCFTLEEKEQNTLV
jgi:hypothetical protein